MHKTVLIVLTVFVLGLCSGCAEQDSAPTSPPAEFAATWVTTLPNLVYGTSVFHPIQVQISGISPDEIDSVKAYLGRQSGNSDAVFSLYDDAGAYQYDNALDFCDSTSGDLIAGDRVFSRRLNAKFADTTGLFTAVVHAWSSGQERITPQDTLLVAQSLPPQPSNLALPDTLSSGFSPLQISLEVIDPDAAAGDSVVLVEMQFYTGAGLALGDPLPLDRLEDQVHFGTIISSAWAMGHASGDYIFAFRAWDTFSMISDSLGNSVYMENLAPHLIETIYPDTVELPATGGSLEVLISIRGWDDQTNGDIQSISFKSQKPDGSYANSGQPIPLLDNGFPFDPARWEEGYLGDLFSGDSLFSATAVLYDTSQTGVYRFTFRAQDLAGNPNELIDSLWVLP